MRTLALLLALLALGCRTEVKPDDSTPPSDTAPPCTDADEDGSCDDVDCDDADASVHPDAEEVCDDLDNDCDNEVDEDDAVDAPTWYEDADNDGFGNGESSATACEPPSGWVAEDLATDCDDDDATIFPGADETCDGVDQDCDGEIDEDATDASDWYQDLDGDGYGGAFEATSCEHHSAVVDNGDDCDDGDASVNPGMDEDPCNEVDDDCDGEVDEWEETVEPLVWHIDGDGDGYGDPDMAISAHPECDPPTGYVSDDTDCDDTDANINPSADEYCDGVDTDCSGVDDDSYALDATTWYADDDGDGYGDAGDATDSCDAGSGYVSDDTDCDDSDADVNPGADEDSCNDIDDDCDGTIDESDSMEVVETFWADADGDGYGDADSWIEEYPSCISSGYVEDDSDCDDSDATAYPGAAESCDGVDNDCDGTADVLGYWPFEAGSGAVAYDDGPLALDGDIVDGTWTTGVIGGGLDFNGSSSYVLLDHDELAPEQGYSISAWVQPTSLTSSSWDTVVSRGSTGSGSLGCCGDSYWLGYYLYGLALYTNVSSTITDSDLLDSTDYSSHVGNWHHLVGTWDAATGIQALYLDGSLTTSGSAYTYVIYDGAPTRIGADTNSGSDVLHFDGIIDEVKILDCALDAGQVATDYADNWPF